MKILSAIRGWLKTIKDHPGEAQSVNFALKDSWKILPSAIIKLKIKEEITQALRRNVYSRVRG